MLSIDKKYLFLIVIIILISNNVSANEDQEEIILKYNKWNMPDLTSIPQDIEFYLGQFEEASKEYKPINQNYFDIRSTIEEPKLYSKTIHKKIFGKKKIMIDMIEQCYLYNYSKYSEDLKAHLMNNISSFDDDNIGDMRGGIITKSTDLKELPTELPCFNLDIKSDNQKFYPIDSNQNDFLKIGSRIQILAISNDEEWTFVYDEENHTIGWINSKNFAYMNMASYPSKNLAILIKDFQYLAKNSPSENFGTILPLFDDSSIMIPKRTAEPSWNDELMQFNQNFKWEIVPLNQNLRKIPLEFNSVNIKLLVNALKKHPYSWGSMYNFTDCSSIIQSFYAAFGLKLPRNSVSQADKKINKSAKEILHIHELSNAEKKKFILKYAIPFRTIFYFPGHVGIYAGQFQDEPIMFHQIWGALNSEKHVKTNMIVGSPIFSTLDYQKTINNGKTLLDRLTELIII